MDDFNMYAINMDAECLHQDFDDVDLYGTKTIEDTSDDFAESIQYN